DMEGRLELLSEWLGAAAAAGRRLPPELLPALLEAGRRHRALRPLIGPVAGPLAGWLGAPRPDWPYASSAPAAESTVDDGERVGPADGGAGHGVRGSERVGSERVGSDRDRAAGRVRPVDAAGRHRGPAAGRYRRAGLVAGGDPGAHAAVRLASPGGVPRPGR